MRGLLCMFIRKIMPTPINKTVEMTAGCYAAITNPGGSITIENYGPGIIFRTEHQVTSNSTPFWGARHKRDRYLLMNAYSKWTSKLEDPLQNLTFKRVLLSNGSQQNVVYTMTCTKLKNPAGLPDWSSGDLYALVATAMLKALSTKVSDTAVSLAEGAKTAGHVARTATRIANALKALKSFNLSAFANALGITQTRSVKIAYGRKKAHLVYQLTQDGDALTADHNGVRYSSRKILRVNRQHWRVQNFIAESWLEYSYGWKPLLNDVYNQMEALAAHTVERSGAVRRQSVSKQLNEYIVKKYVNPANPFWQETAERSEDRSMRMVVYYSIPNGNVSLLNTFGINNPLTVAWELVPFSFVVDWFLPIGQALESLTSTNGLSFAGGSFTEKRKVVQTESISGTGTQVTSYPYILSGQGFASKRYETFMMKRTILANFPLPQWPAFKNPRTFAHAASAIALLQSLFLRK